MNKRKIISLGMIILGLVLAGFSFNLSAKPAQDTPPPDPERGGRLYVSWDLVTNFSGIEARHPLWGNSNTPQIPDRITWRCVNCHAWDYRGSEGRLPYPGMQRGQDNPSLLPLTSSPAEEILAWLDGTNNPDHNFSNYLSDQDLRDISAFISNALVNPDLIATTENNEVQGTISVGNDVYREYCQSCHGAEGEKINFGSTTVPSFMGDLAWANPWRIAHEVHFGHISSSVPSASTLGISFSQQIDLLAYLQTMPRARTIASAETQQIDFSTQSSTQPMVYGAIALTVLIFTSVLISVQRRQQP